MDRINSVSLSYDPLHGYIPFTTPVTGRADELTERHLLDHGWVQRLRHIHQLQTAWMVFPSAEHSRFQHVVGVMHLASLAVQRLYDSLRQVCPDVPSRGCVDALMRMAGLLHDVGHGPFGHFFDAQFLQEYGLTHETVGAAIIRQDLAPLLSRLRRTPQGELSSDEVLDPDWIAFLITRPRDGEGAVQPRWLKFLRSLLCGIYTIDNMDFVLRDAYMTGYSQRAFDLDRLLHYSFFSERGLTIHDRGMDALLRFLNVRAELFRTVYFHRTVRAIDLELTDLFADSKQHLLAGNPLDDLRAYQRFTESSFLVDVSRWATQDEPPFRELGERWQRFLSRQISWKMVCQRPLAFGSSDVETSSIFSDADLVVQRLRKQLPRNVAQEPLRVDIAHHLYRPHTRGPAKDQNFLYDSAQDRIRPLTDHQLFRYLPVSQRICRIYAQSQDHARELAAALDQLLGEQPVDALTNM